MDDNQRSPRRDGNITAWLVVASAAMIGAFLAGLWIGSSARPADPERTAANDAASGSGAPAAARARDDDPRAAEARDRSVRETADAIVQECRLGATGDWEKWQKDTESFRNALKSKCKDSSLWPLHPDEFPLAELNPQANDNYLYEPQRMNTFRHKRPVVAVDRWLKQRGIDLIFVPVPRKPEIYIEQYLSPCPQDGVIAPHVRQTLLELLNNQVEVVDGFPLLRANRFAGRDYLYRTPDPHWTQRGMRILAKDVAERIARYPFAAGKQYGLPIVTSSIVNSYDAGKFDERITLSPNLKELFLPESLTRYIASLPPREQALPDDPSSPVLLIGHSFARGFREILIKELNFLIDSRIHDTSTTEFFSEFLREPEILKNRRVIVWISTEQHLTEFKPLPEPIAKALE